MRLPQLVTLISGVSLGWYIVHFCHHRGSSLLVNGFASVPAVRVTISMSGARDWDGLGNFSKLGKLLEMQSKISLINFK